ncbi:sulfotransferase [Hyphobacterium sp. CCMP332]|nr:sulfotransferase [Hyphobacterium sp. CCMP332]
MRYIFILGCHKSGTSLLRSLFDGHPDLNVVPIESHFIEHLGISGIYPLRKNDNHNLNFYDSLFKLLKEYNESKSTYSDINVAGKINFEILEAHKNKLNNKDMPKAFEYMCKSIFEALELNFKEGHSIVEKSVENFQYASYLKMLYPNSIFIHILRNPYANLVSLRKFKTRANFPSLPELVESINLSFSYALNNVNIISDYFIIKYEALILEAENTMQELMQKINIPFDPILLKPSSMGDEWAGNSMYSNEMKNISNQNMNRWKKEIFPIEAALVNSKLSEHIKKWDYESFQLKQSAYNKAKGETIKTYLRNRLYLYL